MISNISSCLFDFRGFLLCKLSIHIICPILRSQDFSFFFFFKLIIIILFIYLFIYWLCWVFGSAHVISLVVACRLLVAAHGLLVAACMRDLVPRPGIEPGPPCVRSTESYPLDHTLVYS